MDRLFSPITLENLTIKNRLVMAPMCMYAAGNAGHVTDFHVQHYATRAMGGIGLVTVEATGVLENGKITDNCLGIYSDSHIDGLSRLVKAVHANGAKIAIQLAHAGRKCTVAVPQIYGPTDQPFNDTFQTPVAMTEKQIAEVVKAFGDGAFRAKKAVFDMVQIHGAHGYLLSTFLSPLTNTRTDDYGGTVEKQARFLLEITRAVKANFDGPVSLRVNGSDHKDGGLTPETISHLINLVKNQGICLIDVSSGALVSNPDYTAYPGHQIPMSSTIKTLTQLPVIGGGIVTQTTHVQSIIHSGSADLVYLGRRLLTHPFFPLEIADELGSRPDWPYTDRALKSMGRYEK